MGATSNLLGQYPLAETLTTLLLYVFDTCYLNCRRPLDDHH